MYCKNLNYFGLLTPEEQLADIKEYWYNSFADAKALIEGLSDMLYEDVTPTHELAANLSRTFIALRQGTSEDVLTEEQKREMIDEGFTIVAVMKSQWDVFEFWCRMCGFEYNVVVQHKVDAREYKIWKEEDKTDRRRSV